MSRDDNAQCECEWLEEDESCSEPVYAEYKERKYCVLHYPNISKNEAFAKTIQARLNDESHPQYLRFVGVWFPADVSFADRTFSVSVDFSQATFAADLDFRHCEFKGANFAGVQCAGYADFEDAAFTDSADFSDAHFQKAASFARATFERNCRFVQTKFLQQADFAGADFKSSASFMLARFENIADFSAARIANDDEQQEVKYPIEWRRSRFREAHFTGAFFAQCSFRMACFGEVADFRHAVVRDAIDFSIADFNESNFSYGVFARPNFEGTFFLKSPKFNKTEFLHTALFSTTRFPGADFVEATFSGNADFSLARFEGSVSNYEIERLRESNIIAVDATAKSERILISFDRVIFKEGLTFKSTDFFQDRCLLTFEDAVFEKPERVKFQAVSMPPHTFMNVDPRKFHFMDVRWGFIDRRKALDEALSAIKAQGGPYSLPLLELAYRQLAVNAEENNRYGQAADLRYLAMEVARRMRWRRVDIFNLAFWYWILSGYGEKVRRAFLALVIIWLTFAVAYWSLRNPTWWQPKQAKTTIEQPQVLPLTTFRLPEALIYSANIMALQKPEPLPAHWLTKLLVLAETIFGPLQAALLVLAIRRKFMR
jgi:uncharacterized protein YjbI with pentapeptide repeats